MGVQPLPTQDDNPVSIPANRAVVSIIIGFFKTLGLQYSLNYITVFCMEAIYRLNTKDLGIGFVNSIQAAYPGKTVEITVREESDCYSDDPSDRRSGFDETEYLNSTPANREHLDRAQKNIAEGKIISFNSIVEVEQAVKEQAAKR